ncbi:MAG TPA: ribbon-helix-helix domain-containing protein [Stellaceae bacterium]|jgi:predicted DNA-binding ribbon-helix-helix protein|nr:ribbon-helix-helix domain-containing protein [Stellaceae bacterium]
MATTQTLKDTGHRSIVGHANGNMKLRQNAETMRKHSVVIAGHRTSVSLEEAFWQGLKAIADRRTVSVNRLVEMIDSERTTNLSSAIRVFVLENKREH